MSEYLDYNGLQRYHELIKNWSNNNHYQKSETYTKSEFNSRITDVENDVENIETLIPILATTLNQLADKNFVNSSIATTTANFKGTVNSVIALDGITADNNDYAFVVTTDSDGNMVYSRYKYNGSTWMYEYELNNSSFTAVQWAAIQSGITQALVSKLNALPTNDALTDSLDGKVDKVTGKGLSTNDYTTEEKNKLVGVENGAQVNVKPDWNAVSGSNAEILNKPTIPDVSGKADKADTYTKEQVDQLQEQQNEEIQEALDEKANIDGYYETLGAGTATNLKGDSIKQDTFAYRPTAGSLDVESGAVPDGGAYLENIKGNAVAWNQMMLNPDDWVDMGLPSGTLWCKKNIDVTQPNGLAVSPFQYECSFFSWGNTDGHNPISNSAFDYDWGGVNDSSPYYEGQPYGETTGSTLVSDITLPNDAANVNLGNILRMPTSEEYAELFANIKYINADGTKVDTTKTDKRVTVNGVLGLYIESNINGARLFFSCSGYGTGRSWSSRGSIGNYWSSTWFSARYARGLGFNSGGVNPQNYSSRYLGFAVRPVFTPSTTPIDGRYSHKYAATKDTISDLTLIYGLNNEPSSVDTFKSDFKNWFGRPMGAEPYDEGSLIPVTMSALKTVGFNQYNPTTGLVKAIIGKEYQITGTYTKLWESEESSVEFTAYTYGDAVSSDTYYSNNNNHYISSRIISAYDNTTKYAVDSYCVYSNSVYKSNVDIATAEDFDSTKWDLIADVAAMVTEGIFVPMDITPNASGKFTPTKFYLHVEGGNNSDTCIHLVHSGAHDDEYEPYWESQVNVPITQLTGKLNGTGESVVVFPDGMKKTGDVFDEIKVEGGVVKAIKRINYLNLGNYRDWKYNVTGLNLACRVFNMAIGASAIKTSHQSSASNILCSKYRPSSVVYLGSNQNDDKLIGVYSSNNRICIRDDSYTDVETFTASLQGVMFYGELATPQVYILDNFKLPLVYNVDDYGTEEVINAENTHGVAPTLGIRYGLNAADFVRNSPKNFITKESMEKFLDRLGTAMNGVWSMTWDASNNRYDYSFVPNAQSDPQDDDNVEPDEEEPIEEGA